MRALASFCAVLLMVGGCQQMQCAATPAPAKMAATEPATQAASTAAAASISASDLRDILSDLAKGHDDDIKLSWWVSTPLRPVDAPFKSFYTNMGVQHKELLSELKTWGKKHSVDLTFKYGTDVE